MTRESEATALISSGQGGRRWIVAPCALAGVAALSEIDTALLPGLADRAVAALMMAIVGVLAMISAPSIILRLSGFTKDTKALRWLLAVSAIGIATAAWSINPSDSIVRSVMALGFVVAVVGTVERAGFARTTVAISSGLAAVVAGSLLWELLGPGTPVNAATGVHDPGLAGLPRLRGITEHANQFGRVSGLLVVLGSVVSRLEVSRLVRHGMIAVGALGLMASQSRTSMIAVVAAILAYRLLDRRPLVPLLATVGGLGALAMASLAGVSVLEIVTRKGESSELLTATGRSSIWRSAWRLAWEHPLTGSGAFQSPDRMQVAMDAGQVGLDAVDPHNLFLSLFLNGGLMMVLAFVAFVASVAGDGGAPSTATRSGVRILGGLMLWSVTESLLPGLNANLMLCALAAAATIPCRPLEPADHHAASATRPEMSRNHQLVATAAVATAIGGAWIGLETARTTAPAVTITQALAIEDVPPHELTSAHLAIREAVERSRSQFPTVMPPVDAAWVGPLDTLRPNFAVTATGTTPDRAASALGLVLDDVDFIEDLGFALTGPRANLDVESGLVSQQRMAEAQHQSSSQAQIRHTTFSAAGELDLQDRWAAESRSDVLELRASIVDDTERDLIERLGVTTTRVGEPKTSTPTQRSVIGTLVAPVLVALAWAGRGLLARRHSIEQPLVVAVVAS